MSAVLEVLHSERFVDVSPEETWATLLDEGTYLSRPARCTASSPLITTACSERRAQLAHPPYAKPELLAEQPTSCGPGT